MLPDDAWQLKEPIDTFFFDCDSTLSLIEGIDVLATMNGVGKDVHAITKRCMSTTGLSLEVYRQRLDLVQPNVHQINQLAALYSENCATGVKETLQVLQRLNKKIYILSAGLKLAVEQFAQTIGLTPSQVVAVEVYFDDGGHYIGFDERSSLVQPKGKATKIESILKPNERALLIGDGISDWEASDSVTRFVGFAGREGKEWLRTHSEFYLTNAHFWGLLPLSLTTEEVLQLTSNEVTYYLKGLEEIKQTHVLMRGNHYV